MKFNLFTISSLVALTAGQECDYSTYALEVLRLQDASGDFSNYVDSIVPKTDELVTKLASNFGEFKYGLSSFLDKPIPTRGMGYYGNYAALNLPPDYCFKSHGILSSDADSIRQGLERVSEARGWGGDIPENPFEALIFAANINSVGWTDSEITHTHTGLRIERFAVVVTDAVPHVPGDAYNGATLAWNAPRVYADPDNSTGGFGSRSFGKIPNVITYVTDQDHNDYTEMCDLFRIGDLGGVLADAQKARLDTLVTKFGPYPWPKIVDHPGDASLSCSETEYPSSYQVADALKKVKITPIFLLTEPVGGWGSEAVKRCTNLGLPTDLTCLKEIYTLYLSQLGVGHVVATVTAETDVDVTIEALRKGVEQACNRPTEDPKNSSTKLIEGAH